MRIVLTQPKARLADGTDIGRAAATLKRHGFTGEPGDIILLPEVIGEGYSASEYASAIAEMARAFGCHVVGGSQFDTAQVQPPNQGIVVDPLGDIIAHYQKANPYGRERQFARPGDRAGASVRINGVECFVSVCADFFHAETYRTLDVAPDLILVPALSVSRKSSPDMARARWRHAMIARAFEQAAFVAVSDWAYPVRTGGDLPSSGIAGLAHPDPETSSQMLRTLGRSQVRVFDIDLDAARALRADQRARGFEIARARQEQT